MDSYNFPCSAPNCDFNTGDMPEAVTALALLQMHQTNNHVAAAATGSSVKPDKLTRPSITKGVNTEDWNFFIQRWDLYTDRCRLTGDDVVPQLLECCDTELTKDVYRTCGNNLTTISVVNLLATIKALSVTEENALVSRMLLAKMTQDRDEPVSSFLARLRGHAAVCKFQVKVPNCSHCNSAQSTVDYSEVMIRDSLCRGLEDQDIQNHVLSQEDQDMSLAMAVKLVTAKEAGKKSQQTLQDPLSVNAASRYSRKTRLVCDHCKKSHDIKKCWILHPELNPYATCKHCNMKHRKGSQCLKSTSRSKGKSTEKEEDESSTIHDMICFTATNDDDEDDDTEANLKGESPKDITSTISTDASSHSRHKSTEIVLEHYVYDEIMGWKQRRSAGQPYVRVELSIDKKDYHHLGHDISAKTKPAVVSVMADTGCQSCLTGINVAHSLGLKKKDLIQVTLKMNAANKKAIGILGAFLVTITGKDDTGGNRSTKQMVYVTEDNDRMFLNKEACIKLGLISDQFPKIGEMNVAEDEKLCDCPRRQKPPPLPDKMPMAPTEDNVPALRKWLLEYYGSSTFNVCEHQTLPHMEGPPMRLHIDPDAIPKAVHKPRPVPLHWKAQVEAELERDVRLGVIERAPIGEKVEWTAPMHIASKKNGEPRRTVDFQSLNAAAGRETHHTRSPFHQAMSVPHNMKKTVLDAWNGYHSVPVREEDRKYLTFITEWGRFRYRTAPQGYIASGDGYTRRYDDIVAGIPNHTKCVDDCLLWEADIEKIFLATCRWLDVCGRSGIVMNPKKFQFAQDDVDFAGFVITNGAVKPSYKNIQAISEFPTPKNITDIRAFFGMVNQVSYTFAMTKQMEPFRELLKPSTSFYWDETLEKLFDEAKNEIVREIENGVKIFDMSKPTAILTDWSKHGLGFFLLQKHCSCRSTLPECCPTGWKITLCGSRFTHPAESRYKPIEGEALAIVYALNKARYFILGCDNLTVVTDHKPLLKIFGDRHLDDISNVRLQN